ncbi:carbohydrate ABC transporter permease [Lactococcus nasutitermitis]|uniref:Carbohydrate ABC transporter permease n=1 Tax=Lactococcus nasutitermitis TaxID=1652957 RepID=A0ABV9JFL3_9LACT|nr:carbohydrate ABC transporter permease [Lactococcus nasutitermitis]
MTNKSSKATALKVLLYVILIIYALTTLYPFLWAISASFEPLRVIVSGSMSLIPKEFTFSNYQQIFSSGSASFPQWFLNSVIISVIGTAINIFFNSMAGYSLARLSYPGRDKIYYAFLALMMVPGQVLLVPNYVLLTNLGMIDTLTSMIIPSAINISFIFMMRQFFLSFPKDVEEAARIDGLSSTGVFFRIVMPMARPSIATQAVFIFMGFWNNFSNAIWYLKSPQNYTLTQGLQTLISSDGHSNYWNLGMAGSVITIIPIVIIYIIFNKYLLQGVRMDGEK